MPSPFPGTDPYLENTDFWQGFPVPLAPEDAEVHADLAAVFSDAYDRGRFGRLLNYSGSARPSLALAGADWADALLREAGLRGEVSA